MKSNEIPQTISMDCRQYHIFGIIEFISAQGYLGHYVARIKRPNNMWETYDNEKRARVIRKMEILKRKQTVFLKHQSNFSNFKLLFKLRHIEFFKSAYFEI